MSQHLGVFEKNRNVKVGDGTRIAYSELGHRGDRAAVVLCNGWSCSDVYWTDVAPYLVDRGHKVLIPDNRGHGESGLPRHPGRKAKNLKPEEMTLTRIAEDILAVCDDADVDEAVFVGHSMGVQTMFEVYRQAKDRVLGLAAVAGPYENPVKTFMNTDLTALWPLGKIAINILPNLVMPAYRTVINRPKFGYWGIQTLKIAGPTLEREKFAPYLAHLASRDPWVLFKLLDSMSTSSAEDLLPDLAVPLLVVAGAKDFMTPLSTAEKMHELVPDSELMIFEDSGHLLPLEHAPELNKALESLLSRVEQAKAA
jgi:pimeloyl-ACP methyl ester carboxylesterase